MAHYSAQWKDGFEVLWRNLTWGEYRRFKQRYEQSPFEEPMDIALDIYRTVYVKGPDPDFIPAGILGYICKQQMINNPFSGRFEDINPAIEMARRIVTGDYLLSAKALISASLHYKLEEIDSWDPNTFFLRLAQTEIINGRTFDPVDPRAKTLNTPPPKPQRNLSPTQQKAIARARERGRD